MFRFEETHRRELVEAAGEEQVAAMEAFEQNGIDRGNEVGDTWCRCEGETETAYYRRAGYHGWYCLTCRGITQTG